MSISLHTPGTGYPDLEAKIAYGLARVGIEAGGMEKVTIQDDGGFYTITIDTNEDEFAVVEKTFNMLCRRLLSSEYIPFSTPGIPGRSTGSISVKENEDFSLDVYKSIVLRTDNKKSENICRHGNQSVGNVIGFTASTSFHNKRDGLDTQLQYRNPKDKSSPKLPRRPTNPKSICKTCAMLALLGTWYASFIFNVGDKEVIVIPIPKDKINGSKLQEIFALQHQIRKDWINQEIPQVVLPLIFLSRIPSSADILSGFNLFIALLSRQQGYHVDGLFLIPTDNYLDFVGANPYNIATVDNMLRNRAYSALQELNNAIYNRVITSLPKFARLYVQETSTNDWINLVYPETSKYLLKEVAMISSEIIENPALGSLARTIRYFVRDKKYSYADNIRNARQESKDFEGTIAKMLREGQLRLEQKEKIHLPTDEEMKEVFRLADQEFDKVKTALVILAFSFPVRGEEGIAETIEEVENA